MMRVGKLRSTEENRLDGLYFDGRTTGPQGSKRKQTHRNRWEAYVP